MGSDLAGSTIAAADLAAEDIQRTMARSGRLGRDRFYAGLDADLRGIIRNLEAAAAVHQESPEDLMTGWIVSSLKAAGYKAAHDEDERGHADIKVESDKLDLKWLAEAKIHSSYEYALDGMKQLVTRYASGRDPKGGFLLYIFKKKAAMVAKRFREHLTKDTDLKTKSIEDLDMFARFRSVHLHDAGTDYAVDHHLVLMHIDPKDKSARSRVVRTPDEIDEEGDEDELDETAS